MPAWIARAGAPASVIIWVWVVCTASAGAATLAVSTTRDGRAVRGGRCSLRQAIAAVDAPGTRTDCGTASRGSNTIVLRARRYVLSMAPIGRDDNSSGDLNLIGTGRITILGRGTGRTVIDARRLGDRVLEVARGGRLTLRGLTITGGHAPAAGPGMAGREEVSCSTGGAGDRGGHAGDGGGISNAGSLTLDIVAVVSNQSGAGGPGGAGGSPGEGSACPGGEGGRGGSGGGIYNSGRLTVTDSTIRGNTAGAGGPGGAGGSSLSGAGGPGGRGGSGGSGGGIYNRGRLAIRGSTISSDRAGPGASGGRTGAGVTGSGLDGDGGPGGSGGGIFSTHAALGVQNSTLAANSAGPGGGGGGSSGSGGNGGDGGGVAVTAGPSALRDDTLAENGVGAGGVGSTASGPGASGSGGALYAQPARPAGDMRLQSTIVASSPGSGCAGSTPSAIIDDGHDLSYGDRSCPGRPGNPRLGPLKDNGGATQTMALGVHSAAINRVPRAGCPARDQRGVRRPQGRGCDIGAYEFATPKITILAPFHHASYERGSRILARFRCGEGGIASTIAECRGSVPLGHAIGTRRLGNQRFQVTAIDKSGHRVRKTIHYFVWDYVNPVRRVGGLTPRRIDLGVDYAGSGPLLALGDGRVTMASDTDSGPESCWAISCWPGGGVVVYRLSDGPFAGRYVYMAEHLTVSVRAGQTIRAGQQIGTLYSGYPWLEIGWAAGSGPEALAMADGHRCTCSDPGGWSTVEGRNLDHVLVLLGAPSGYLQSSVPNQSMPAGWPSWSG